MTLIQVDPFSKPIRLVERSKAGQIVELSLSERFFFLPPCVRLLEELSMSSLLEYFLSLIISDSESFTFIRGRVNPVLTYFMKPMLDSR